MADKGSDSGEEEDPTIAEDVVVTKYKMAGDMANRKCQVFRPRGDVRKPKAIRPARKFMSL